MSTPKVSIIMPVYNCEKYIEKTINSILSQTYKDYEIIFVDDGSSDRTAAIVKKYLGPSIQYIYQANAGGSVSRNKGIGLAKGKYIAFCDHDDIWKPEKLKEQIRLLESNKDIGLVFCNLDIIDKNDIIVRSKMFTKKHKERPLELLLDGCFVTTMSLVIIRRECLNSVGLFVPSLKYSGDWELYIRIAKKYRFDFVNQSLVNYRVHDNNQTNNLDMQFSEYKKTLTYIWSDSTLRREFPEAFKRIHHRIYFDLGVEYFDKGKMHMARLCFKKSLRLNHVNWTSLSYILKTFLGKPYLSLRSFKRTCINANN